MEDTTGTTRKPKSIPTSGGGAATQRGTTFQNSAAAWLAVRILAEQAASPLWDLPADVTLESISCETEHPTDDILVTTSASGWAFVQAKRGLELGRRPSSRFASAVDQFVRQFALARNQEASKPYNRSLSTERDRLVLLVSQSSSGRIREHLRSALDKIRPAGSAAPFSAPTMNQDEREALDVFRGHLAASWKRAFGHLPSEDEFAEFASLVRVFTLDADQGGDAEREAKDSLRSVVLHDPKQADVSWNTLVQVCAGLASSRSGADRAALQRALLDAGVGLRAVRSYWTDIDQLRSHSRTTVNLLASRSSISVGATIVKINRPSTEALRAAAENASLVVVGEPGAGKSGALHDVVAGLQDEGRDVVFLAVDRLETQSLGGLRNDIGLSHELVDVLANWHGPSAAFLVIDALDAARHTRLAQVLVDLMSQIARTDSRWRIIASIRKFDLRYSTEVSSLFAGPPPSKRFRDGEFSAVRHINIPRLDEEELSQIHPQSQELADLVARSERTLREMLTVPFNLKLAGELLGEGIPLEELTPIRTQIELLDRYWLQRVVRHDGLGDAREEILRRVANEMVEARQLRVDRTCVARDLSASPILDDMLESHILLEWQPRPVAKVRRRLLAFDHHVLFDYAVARLLLCGDSRTFIERLVDDPELVIAIRPSLVLHFQRVWFAHPARDMFWTLVIDVTQAQGMPEIGKVIGPGVAAELASSVPDLDGLCTALESADGRTREAADQALRHLFGALLSIPVDADRAVVGKDGGPWCELLVRLTTTMRASIAYTVRRFLSTVLEHPETLTAMQRNCAGEAARRVLEFAWKQHPRDSWLVIHSLQAVCRTFEADADASGALIRRCLEPEHLKQYGFEEMPWLASEVPRLASLDPGLVEDIFRSAFAHQEASDAKTPVGASRILPMTSTRRQDYHMALWQLAEAYPEFLKQAPIHATRALIAVMDAYVAQDHPTAWREEIEERFDLNEREARIRSDLSCIWDQGSSSSLDGPFRMLDAFEDHLDPGAEGVEGLAELQGILDTLITHNALAVIWRRLLLAGSRAPDTLGVEVRELGWAIPVLTCPDTTDAACQFLHAVFSHLSPEERARVERAILSIPKSATRFSAESRGRIRKRLLIQLAPDRLVTAEARELLLKPQEPVPDSRTAEHQLVQSGPPIDAVSDGRFQTLMQPIREFVRRHSQSAPTPDEIRSILPALRSLQDALLVGAPRVTRSAWETDNAWDCLAEACSVIATCADLTCKDQVGVFVRSVLLQAAEHRCERPRPDFDSRWDHFPFWGKPAPRVEAAGGLMKLAARRDCLDDLVQAAIEQFISDPVPAVRFQLAKHLTSLYQVAPEIMWRLLERCCEEEVHPGVLAAIVVNPLQALAKGYPSRVSELGRMIHERVAESPDAKLARRVCADLFLDLYLRNEDPFCEEILREIAGAPTHWEDEVQEVIHRLRHILTIGPVSPPDPVQDRARHRGFGLLQRVVVSTRAALCALEAEHEGMPLDSWTSADRERATVLVRVAHSIGKELYFGSGAYDEKTHDQVLDVEKKRRFLEEAGPILDELSKFGLPALAHDLLQTLEAFVSVAPARTFLRVGRIVQSGQRGGYQYETLAVDLIARLIERYLAEYGPLIRQDQECQGTLLDVLDTFVQAGWPRAWRLTYRLHEIYR